MTKVAVVTFTDRYSNYDDYDRVIEKVSDFVEVSEEDYTLLEGYARRTNEFQVIVFIQKQKEVIEFSVKSQLEFVKKEKEKAEQMKAEQERKKLAAKLKKDLKAKEDREKLFNELRQEFEK